MIMLNIYSLKVVLSCFAVTILMYRKEFWRLRSMSSAFQVWSIGGYLREQEFPSKVSYKMVVEIQNWSSIRCINIWFGKLSLLMDGLNLWGFEVIVQIWVRWIVNFLLKMLLISHFNRLFSCLAWLCAFFIVSKHLHSSWNLNSS